MHHLFVSCHFHSLKSTKGSVSHELSVCVEGELGKYRYGYFIGIQGPAFRNLRPGLAELNFPICKMGICT